MQSIVSPITTRDEVLGQDKRKVHLFEGTKNTAAVCMKDGRILSKFWGEEDIDA